MWVIVHVGRPSWTFSAGNKVRQVDNDVMSRVRRKLEDHTTVMAGSIVTVLGVVCEHQMVD